MKKGKGRWMAFLLAIVLSLTMIPGYAATAQDSEHASVPENTLSENEVQADQSDGTETEQSEEEETGNLILYSGHLQSDGDLAAVADGAVFGTTGQAKRLEAIRISKGEGLEYVDGSIMYRVHVQTYGTQSWVSDGALAGTTGQAKRLEAVQIYLTGDLASQYDIYYRTHIQSYGWLQWVKGGTAEDCWSGSSGLSKRMEAIQIVLVKKDENGVSQVPSSDEGGIASASAYGYITKDVGKTVVYSGHQQTYGNLSDQSDGAELGTTGQSKRLEAISIRKGQNLSTVSGSIQYRVHVQKEGTQSWVSDGALAGTTGQAKRIEAIQVRLTGNLSEQYDIYYSVHVQKYGWTKWTKGLDEGDSTDGRDGWCGTIGLSLRVESIRIVLVEKNGTAPTNDGLWSYLTKSDLGSIVYSGHQQSYGDLAAVSNGTSLGTTGAGKRLEAVSISLSGGTVSGSVQYRAHVQKEGWQSWVSDGALAGTTGLSRRMEAIEVKLSGDIANYCDVWYRVYVEKYGWLGWAKNGQTAGTTGISYRIESIEVRLVPKAAAVPGANSGYYKDTPLITSGRIVKNGNIYYYNTNGVLYRTVYGNQKMVALTYDDGPSQYTSAILDILEKYNSTATFFVVGERVGTYSSIIQRAYSLGCQIGNHTYNHTTLTSVSTSVIQNQISATNTAVKNVTGVSPTVMRPPGGSHNSTVRNTVGMPIILWSIDTLDWKTRNAASTVSAVLNHVQDGDIVLMHDLYSATATASLTIIPSLISKGYQLVTVEEMALLHGGMSNGVVYSAFR